MWNITDTHTDSSSKSELIQLTVMAIYMSFNFIIMSSYNSSIILVIFVLPGILKDPLEIHATISLKVILAAGKNWGSKFSLHAYANSFMALSCSTFVREGICDVKYCSFSAVKMVFSCLAQTTETLFLVMPFNVERVVSGEWHHTKFICIYPFSFNACMDLEMRPDSGCLCVNAINLSQGKNASNQILILQRIFNPL